MKTINEFKQDFAEEIESGDLIIADEISEATIFVLRDGTIIGAKFNEYGDRGTDHRQVLREEGWTMDDLVTIEPETQTLILPDNELTWRQAESLDGLEEIYPCLNVLGSNRSGVEIYLIQYLIDCGVTLKDALIVVKTDSWALIPDDGIDDFSEEEKDEHIWLENGTVVDVWGF